MRRQDGREGWWRGPCSHSSHLAVGWRLFDDSTVTTVDESQVVTRYAYVLFYRRRNSPVERPPRAGHSEHHPELGPAAESAASQVRHGEAPQARGAQLSDVGGVEHSFLSSSP